jgi:hypothetical protein
MDAEVRTEILRAEVFHLRSSAFICGLFLFLLSGCSSAVSHGTNTALSGVDLVQMTDDMANKIASDPGVQQAIARQGALKVVVLPAENRMRAEVLPSGQAETFTGRVRTLLSHELPDKFTWVMNRDTFYRLRGREIEGVEPGPAPEAVSPDYALSAVFTSLAEEDRKHRSSYYVCTFSLTDLRDRTVLWSGAYDVKKIAVKGFLD